MLDGHPRLAVPRTPLLRIRIWRLALFASPMSERRAAGSWHRSLSRVLLSGRILIRLTVCPTAPRTVPPTGTGDSHIELYEVRPDRCLSDFEPRRCADLATEGAPTFRSESTAALVERILARIQFRRGCEVCYDRFSLENVAEIHIC